MAVDVNEIKRSLDSSSGLNRSLLIGFYSLMVYLAITIASVSGTDIFFPNHKLTLPILRIDLDITYFFTFAPLVVLIIHVNLMVNLSHHRNKLEAYLLEDAEANPLYYHPFLYNFIRKSSLDTEESRKYHFATTNFLRIFIWTSLVILPLFVLIFMQVKFLPAQNRLVNLGLVAVVFLDALFLWRFRKAISTQPYADEEASPADAEAEASSPAPAPANRPFRLQDYIPVFINQILRWLKPVMVVTTPLLSLSLFLSATSTPSKSSRYHFEMEDMVLAESQSDVKGILGSAPKLETAWAELAMADKVEGQNITYGQFDRSIFTRISFRGSDLSASSFQYTRFEYANFQDAEAPHTDFSGANIRVGLFYRTRMPDANFANASFGVVDFDSATLHRANFRSASLYGASFQDADLSGAVFYEADLAGADFSNANLTGADFTLCDLNGTNFAGANLRGAVLTQNDMVGADFTRARMRGAVLGACRTDGATFFNTNMDGAVIYKLVPNCLTWKVSNPDKVFVSLSADSTFNPLDSARYARLLADKVQVSPQTAVLTPARSFFDRIGQVKPDCTPPFLDDHIERFNPATFASALQDAVCNSPFTSCEKIKNKLDPKINRLLGPNFCDCPASE